VTAVTKDPRDILIAPVVSEKSYGLLDEGKYTFIVDPRANKTEIKIAIEQVFAVKVESVNTINRKGKTRRTKFGLGKRKDTKRAIVTLREGTIDIFGGPVGGGRPPRAEIRDRSPWESVSTSRRRRGAVAPPSPTSSRSRAPRRRSRWFAPCTRRAVATRPAA
jgi:large subunit ribosomal protein L23